MGPEEPWHVTSRQYPHAPRLNLFVTSSPDSLALPGMFLIVAFSHEDIYNRSMAADRISQRSIQALFTENEEEVELCMNLTFVVRCGDEGSVRGPDFDDPHGLAAFVP